MRESFSIFVNVLVNFIILCVFQFMWDSFPLSLLHLIVSLLNYSHPVLGGTGDGGVLWVWDFLQM